MAFIFSEESAGMSFDGIFTRSIPFFTISAVLSPLAIKLRILQLKVSNAEFFLLLPLVVEHNADGRWSTNPPKRQQVLFIPCG